MLSPEKLIFDIFDVPNVWIFALKMVKSMGSIWKSQINKTEKASGLKARDEAFEPRNDSN